MQRSIYLIYDDGSLYLLGSGALQFPNDDSKWSLLFWCEAWRSLSVLVGKTVRWSKTLKGGYKKTSSCLLQREIHLKLAILGHFLQSSSFLMQPPGEHSHSEFRLLASLLHKLISRTRRAQGVFSNLLSSIKSNQIKMSTNNTAVPENDRSPEPSRFVKFMRRIYRPLGFSKGYNFPLCKNFS